MLIQLSIKNFSIFSDSTIDFTSGFNIITGESGAGKSVFISALSLISGERAMKEYIRKGCDFAQIEAVYQITDSIWSRLSDEFDIAHDDDLLVITRQIYSDSHSICKVNGKIRTLLFLKQISAYLCDIHGQYENQSLLDPANHQVILDKLYRTRISELDTKYKGMLKEYDEIVAFILKNSGSDRERIAKKDLLNYQINEIFETKIESFNIEELNDSKRYMENVEKYMISLKEAMDHLNSNDMLENLYMAARSLEKIKDVDKVKDISQNILDNYYILKDNYTQLTDISEEFVFNEDKYDKVIEKLEIFDKLSYKYGATIEDITAFRREAEKQLYDIENFDRIYKEKTDRLKELQDKLYSVAEELNKVRIYHASVFSSSIMDILHSLEMKDVYFEVRSTFHLDKNSLGFYDFKEKGMYDIEFYITTNKGAYPLPLAKIASGGEISRIMLAIKCIISTEDEIETYIFDEIETGISGEAAVMTARKLSDLSKTKQVLCISHLPQIAAKGDHHFLIYKKSDANETVANIKELTYEERVRELAILFDGHSVTDEGTRYARNLLEKNKKIG